MHKNQLSTKMALVLNCFVAHEQFKRQTSLSLSFAIRDVAEGGQQDYAPPPWVSILTGKDGVSFKSFKTHGIAVKNFCLRRTCF